MHGPSFCILCAWTHADCTGRELVTTTNGHGCGGEYQGWLTCWGGGCVGGWGLDCLEQDHGEEDAHFRLEGVPELDQQGVEDGAGQRLGGRDVAGRVLEQGEAEVLLDGPRELLGALEGLPAVLQQHLQQLQRQHLRSQTASGWGCGDVAATSKQIRPLVAWVQLPRG